MKKTMGSNRNFKSKTTTTMRKKKIKKRAKNRRNHWEKKRIVILADVFVFHWLVYVHNNQSAKKREKEKLFFLQKKWDLNLFKNDFSIILHLLYKCCNLLFQSFEKKLV